MREPVFLDTSYVLALVNTKDEFHTVAQALADQVSEPLVTTEAVLTEIGNALSKPESRQLAADTLYDLINDPDVEVVSVSTKLFSLALQLYSTRMDKEWGLTDCISFIVMDEKNIKSALTTDHHFEQAGFRALMLEYI